MQNAPPAKPLFITDAARSLYFNAYDAVLKIAVLENTGHTPNMERPEETNRLLLEILKR